MSISRAKGLSLRIILGKVKTSGPLYNYSSENIRKPFFGVRLTPGPNNVTMTELRLVTLVIRTQFPSSLEHTNYVTISPEKVQLLVKFLHIGRSERDGFKSHSSKTRGRSVGPRRRVLYEYVFFDTNSILGPKSDVFRAVNVLCLCLCCYTV